MQQFFVAAHFLVCGCTFVFGVHQVVLLLLEFFAFHNLLEFEVLFEFR